jgi:hypothetical protein
VLHYSSWNHPDHDARKNTKHHNVLTKCRLDARIAISFRIPPCTTYLTVGHVVTFKQYWLLLVGDIDYTVTELEEKKTNRVEQTRSKGMQTHKRIIKLNKNQLDAHLF